MLKFGAILTEPAIQRPRPFPIASKSVLPDLVLFCSSVGVTSERFSLSMWGAALVLVGWLVRRTLAAAGLADPGAGSGCGGGGGAAASASRLYVSSEAALVSRLGRPTKRPSN